MSQEFFDSHRGVSNPNIYANIRAVCVTRSSFAFQGGNNKIREIRMSRRRRRCYSHKCVLWEPNNGEWQIRRMTRPFVPGWWWVEVWSSSSTDSDFQNVELITTLLRVLHETLIMSFLFKNLFQVNNLKLGKNWN